LDSDIPWRRDAAFRLLVEQGGPAIAQVLKWPSRKAAPGGASAVARLRLLEISSGLNSSILGQALEHPDSMVRQNAVLLSENRFPLNDGLTTQVIGCLEDPDPHVRYQAALSLGGVQDPRIIPGLARLAVRQASDRWTRAAILCSVPGRANAEALLRETIRNDSGKTEGALVLAAELGRQIASGLTRTNASAVHAELARELEPAPLDYLVAVEVGWARALGADFKFLVASNRTYFDSLWTRTRALPADGRVPLTLRSFALEVMTADLSAEATSVLVMNLAAERPLELQRAAARALIQPDRVESLSPLLTVEQWNGYVPGVRAMILDRLAGDPELAATLLQALEKEQIPASALTAAQREQLRKSKKPEVRLRAEKLFSAPAGDRENAFAQAKGALALKAAPANGRKVFEKSCAICHRFNQEGIPVGPDLFDIRHQPKETILFHIILPEAEIAPNFVNYECELKDGRTVSGLLSAETTSALTFRMAQGVEESVARAQVARLSASRLSLMPQELEKAMTLQDMADLLGYLRGEE
jgi:putative heme-binding domain-containing protein